MGINTFLVDRRTVTLVVGGEKQTVGTLRRFFKLTELDDERRAEMETAERNTHSPIAVMLAEVHEARLATSPDTIVNAHVVIGWDEGRGSVTDFKWDFLPVLGYAIRDPASAQFLLYEDRDGLLYAIDKRRAHDLGLIDQNGKMKRHGQPVITAAENVRPFLDKYSDADCVLSNGKTENFLTEIESGHLPPADWFVGKRPMDIMKFAAT